MATCMPVPRGSVEPRRHSSNGATSGGSTVVHTGTGSDSRWPSVNWASTRTRSSWRSWARTWLARRPRRSTSTVTVAGPTSGEET